MNSTCFRFIADGRLKRKLRPMKIYPTLCNQSFLSHPRFYTTRVFSFVLPFFLGGGGKIEIKKSLSLTDKINSKIRLKKVRTNIAVDEKKNPTRSHQPLHGVEFRNRLYLLLQEIDQEKVQEPPGIKSHPAVPWFFASSPLVRQGTVYNTLRFRHQSICLDQKKEASQKFSGTLRPSCNSLLLSGARQLPQSPE